MDEPPVSLASSSGGASPAPAPMHSTENAGAESNPVGELMPQEAYLWVFDLPGDGQDMCVAHSLTLETFKLSGKGWAIEADGDGFCCLVNSAQGDEATMLVEETLHKQLYVSEENELFVAEQVAGSLKMWSLTSNMSEYELVALKVPTGALFADVNLQVAFIRWCCSGCRYLWSLAAIYEVLQLSTFKGCASTWAHNGAPRWERFLASLCEHHPHYWPGRLSNQAAAAKDGPLKVWPLVLDWPSATTFGLMALLIRWGALSPREGGLREADAQARCKELLAGLVNSVLVVRAVHIPLRFNNSWAPTWPAIDSPESLTM